MSGRQAWLWLPVLVYMAGIFYVQGLSSPPSPPGVNDKVQHLAGYAGLAVLAARAAAGGFGRPVTRAAGLLAIALASGYGITDEIHQGFVPERTRDLVDWYADTAGAVAGTGLIAAWGILVTSRVR